MGHTRTPTCSPIGLTFRRLLPLETKALVTLVTLALLSPSSPSHSWQGIWTVRKSKSSISRGHCRDRQDNSGKDGQAVFSSLDIFSRPRVYRFQVVTLSFQCLTLCLQVLTSSITSSSRMSISQWLKGSLGSSTLTHKAKPKPNPYPHPNPRCSSRWRKPLISPSSSQPRRWSHSGVRCEQR